MRCIKCNYDNLDGLKYCVSCGSPLMTQEDKQKMAMDSEKKMKTLYLIIGILVILLVVLVVMLVMGVGFGKSEKPEEIAKANNIEPATLGTWLCNSNPNATDYTIVFELNEDGSFRFGAYGALETNHISGTYTSNSYNKKEGNYNLYNLSMNQTKIVNGSSIQEGQVQATYSIAITDDGTQSIFTNGSNNTSYYCKKN